MTNYYIEKENKIVFVEMDKDLLQRTVGKDVEIKETERPLVLSEDGTYFVFADTPEYEQEQAEKEKARILELSMTRSDFFDGTIKAFGVGQEELLIAINQVLTTLTISDIEKKVALNNYQNALNFYRKHPLFTMLSNVDIPISEQLVINISSEQWDKFFDETNKKNPLAYKELLPKFTLEIKPTPEDSLVVINGEESTSITETYGTNIEYSVSKEGYQTKTDTVSLTKDMVIEVELTEVTEDETEV